MENQHALQHTGTRPLIGIDASRALRARRTGTERYALEIIRHILELPAAAQFRWRLYIDATPSAATWQTLLRSKATEQNNGQANTGKVEIRHLPGRRLWTHRALHAELERDPPDLLFVPAHVLPFSWQMLRACLWPQSRAAGTRFVVTVHDLGYHRFPAAHTWPQRLYLPVSTRWNGSVADHVITPTSFTATDLHQRYGVPLTKISVIHEAPTAFYSAGIDIEPAELGGKSETSIGSGQWLPTHYALYVGTLQPRKNLRRLLLAYAKNSTKYDVHWHLVFAGAPGKQATELMALAASLGISNRVHFLGYVADETLAALYHGAHIFVFPSLFEGFGLPVLEAQHYGVPVMCANNSSLPEVAGDAALLVDPTDVDAIADAMLRLSEDEALRQQLIERGYANANRFSWKKAARETLAVFEKVLGHDK